MKQSIQTAMLLICSIMLPAAAMAGIGGLGESVLKASGKTVVQKAVHSRSTAALLSAIEKRAGVAMSKRAEKLAAQHGSAALKVLSKDPDKLIPAIERFSQAEQARLLDTLARKEGLRRFFGKYGDDVLKLELRSNGQATAMLGAFGSKALQIAGKLNAKQLLMFASLSGRFKGADAKTVEAFLDLIGKYTGRVFDWIERHPRLLYTATASALVLSLKKELLGDPEAGSQGLVQHLWDSVLETVAPYGAGAALLWLCFRSWIRMPKQPRPQPAEQQPKGFRFFRRKQDDFDTFIDVEPI